MLKRYAARKAAREEKQRLAAELGCNLLAEFEGHMARSGVPLDSLIQRLEFTSDEAESDWHVWWEREGLSQQIDKVRKGIQNRYLTKIGLGGSRVPSPGEAQTIMMWMEAERKSRETLVAAIFTTLIKSTDRHHEFAPSRTAWEALKSAEDQAFLQLKRQGVDTYSTARSWFLPERLTMKGSPQTGEEITAQLGELISDFLERWLPVQVSVKFGSRSDAIGR